MANIRAVRLKTVGDVSRELGKVYNQLKRNEIEVSAARGQTYILNTLFNCIKETELIDRIENLESKVNSLNIEN